MIEYEDGALDMRVRVYDRGLDLREPTTFGEHQLTYRSGDIVAPRIGAAEPLALELADFDAAIHGERPPCSHARLGLEVVRVLDAARMSADRHGDPVVIASGGGLVARSRPFTPTCSVKAV
jgi:hypothetical protein